MQGAGELSSVDHRARDADYRTAGLEYRASARAKTAP